MKNKELLVRGIVANAFAMVPLPQEFYFWNNGVIKVRKFPAETSASFCSNNEFKRNTRTSERIVLTELKELYGRNNS